jgi:hypothetical protein
MCFLNQAEFGARKDGFQSEDRREVFIALDRSTVLELEDAIACRTPL